MKTKTQKSTPKKADKSLLIERTVFKLGGIAYPQLTIHCKPRTRLIVYSMIPKVGAWVKRAQADVWAPPHHWTEYEKAWAGLDMRYGVEYKALAVPGYGK